jgi:hypothetical protein
VGRKGLTLETHLCNRPKNSSIGINLNSFEVAPLLPIFQTFLTFRNCKASFVVENYGLEFHSTWVFSTYVLGFTHLGHDANMCITISFYFSFYLYFHRIGFLSESNNKHLNWYLNWAIHIHRGNKMAIFDYSMFSWLHYFFFNTWALCCYTLPLTIN